MSKQADAFNRTRLSHFINSSGGRVFRLVAGLGFLTTGLVFRDHALGVGALAWSVLPLSAAAFDVCWISALLGGPIEGADLETARRLVRGSTGVDRAIDLARSYIDDAVEAVATLGDTPAAVALAGSAEHLLVDVEAALAA